MQMGIPLPMNLLTYFVSEWLDWLEDVAVPLTPALSPRRGRGKNDLRSSSPSDGERARVRGCFKLPRYGFKAEEIEESRFGIGTSRCSGEEG